MTSLKLTAENYLSVIDHLEDYAHLIYRGHPERMDAALKAARGLPELVAACKAVSRLTGTALTQDKAEDLGRLCREAVAAAGII